jgi:hypothetical protein
MAFRITQHRLNKNAGLNLNRSTRPSLTALVTGYRRNNDFRVYNRLTTAPLSAGRGKYVFSTTYVNPLLPNTAGNLCRNSLLFTGSRNSLFRKCDNPLVKLLWLSRYDSLNQQHTDTALTASSLHTGLFMAFSRIWMQSGLLLRQQKLLNNLPTLLNVHQTLTSFTKQSAFSEFGSVPQLATTGFSAPSLTTSVLDETVTSTFSAADLSLLRANDFFFDALLVENVGYTTF